MAGQRGRDVLIKIGDGGSPESFAIVAGINARSLALGAGLVDVTTTESQAAWRELSVHAEKLLASADATVRDLRHRS